jgi:uncharacterized protein (TIGR02466 family)
VERLDLFATPVFVFDVPGTAELNRALVARLLEEERGSPGLQRINHGGWHSEMTLDRREEACFRDVMRVFREHVGRVVSALAPGSGVPAPRLRSEGAWGMIMRRGDCATMHSHGGVHWALAYYPDAGDGDPARPSGQLLFSGSTPGVRPVPELGLFQFLHTFVPRTGALAVFPGWLKHQVLTYEGTRPRVSMSSNFMMDFAPGA